MSYIEKHKRIPGWFAVSGCSYSPQTIYSGIILVRDEPVAVLLVVPYLVGS